MLGGAVIHHAMHTHVPYIHHTHTQFSSLLASQLLKHSWSELEGRLEAAEVSEVTTEHHLPVERVDPTGPDALLVSVSNYQSLYSKKIVSLSFRVYEPVNIVKILCVSYIYL